MKCAILLLCVAAAHGFMPMMYGHRAAAYSLNTGIPMAFLRKKRDLDDSNKSVAIHVANRGLVPITTYSRRFAASPFIFRKKRAADPLIYTNLGLGYSSLGYRGLHYNPFIFRKKRDADQQVDQSALSFYSNLGYSPLGISSLGYRGLRYSPLIFRKKRDADQQADESALSFYSAISPLGYSRLSYPYWIRK